jgi:hypothetical protein
MLDGTKEHSSAHHSLLSTPSPSFRRSGSARDPRSDRISHQEELRSRPRFSTASVAQASRLMRIQLSYRSAGAGGLRYVKFRRSAGCASTSPVAAQPRSCGRAQRVSRSRYPNPSRISFVSTGPFARLCSGSRVPRMASSQLRTRGRVPSKKSLQRTCQLVTPFAKSKGRAKLPRS